MATNRAGYRLKDQFDQEVLGYVTGYKQVGKHLPASVARTAADIPGTKAVSTAEDNELLLVNQLRKDSFGNISGGGNHSVPVAPRLPGATALPTATVSPSMIVARMSQRLDIQNVPTDGRWLILDPVIFEILKDEDSRLFNADFGESGALRNGLTLKNFHGFRVYMSNNLPKIGTGPMTTGTTNQNDHFGVIVAGHDSALATAEQINKTESYRDPDSFADVVRGLHLYGRKILRSEAIVTCKYNVA